MKKQATDNRMEVKATVTVVLDSKTDVIYDGGIHREAEREVWKERQEMLRDFRNRRYDRHVFMDQDAADVDGILPRRDCYLETTVKVKARYTVDRREYEQEIVLAGTDSCRLAGKKIYLTLDPAHPEEPLKASRYKSGSLGDTLLACGMLMLMMIFSAAALFLLYWSQVL